MKIALYRENLLFFSFPHKKGWSAAVDGQPVEIVKADYGLMAVDVPAGTHTITFTYVPYGFQASCVLSLAALMLILLFGLLPIGKRRLFVR